MSNQSTQIRGKSLLVSFIASERGGKKLIQDDLRLDTTRKDDLHYAERWSQDRGSLSPTTQSPQRSRFYNPPRFPKTFSNLPSGHPAGHLVQKQEEQVVPWEKEGTVVTPGRVLLISLISYTYDMYNIAWLSLNWILERSWVALYSVVCLSVCLWGIGVTWPNLHFFQYIQAYKPFADPIQYIKA